MISASYTVEKKGPGRYLLDGVKVPSVTTILEVLAKPALLPWATRTGVKWACDGMLNELQELLDVLSPDAPEPLTAWQVIERLRIRVLELQEEAPREPRRVARRAADFGTEAHGCIEHFLRTGEHPELVGRSPEVRNCWTLFEDFWGEAGFCPIHVEAVVGSRQHGFAGTLDCLARDRQGLVWLLDWKTGNDIWPEMLLQVVAYARAATEIGLPPPERALIVRIGREDAHWSEQEVQDWEQHWLAFLAARNLWLWQQAAEADRRGR